MPRGCEATARETSRVTDVSKARFPVSCRGSREGVLRCEYTWPATPEHIRDARAHVADLARRAGAPTETLDGVRLAVSEAVSNVVVHGYRDRSPGDVTVTAEAEDHELRVVVRDDGCGLTP